MKPDTSFQRLAASDPLDRSVALLDDLDADAMLGEIMRTPPPRRARRARPALAVGVASLVVCASAVALSPLPDIVRDGLQRANHDGSGMGVIVDRARLVATLRVAGGRLELYEAPTRDGGRCLSLVRRGANRSYLDKGGFECRRDATPDALDVTDQGNSSDGGYVYGRVPPVARIAEVSMLGRRRATFPVIDAYFIGQLGPQWFSPGDDTIRAVARDAHGKIVGRSG